MPETPSPPIADRHSLRRDDLCEVYRVGVLGGSRRHFARYRYTREGAMHFDRPGRPPLVIAEDKIRTIRVVTPEYVASQFFKGETVSVRKYGGDYYGEVTAIGRTRLTVRFMTRAGKVKEQSFAAVDVEAQF